MYFNVVKVSFTVVLLSLKYLQALKFEMGPLIEKHEWDVVSNEIKNVLIFNKYLILIHLLVV